MSLKPYLIDTHAHLCAKEYDSDRERVIQDAFDADVKKIINIGASIGESREVVKLVKSYENIWAAVGIHPNECGPSDSCSCDPRDRSSDERGQAPQLQEIESLAKEPKVVAIGETGLDFAPPPLGETARSKQAQENIFIHLLELAKNTDLPLIIHSRDAAQETYNILSKSGSVKGVIHCFSYSWDWAEKFLNLGFHLSFTGIVTFPNAKTVQETASKTPLEKMMVETDCPFLAPQPVRGQRNGPKNVIMIAKKIAELKGISFEKVAEVTTKNAEDVFGI